MRRRIRQILDGLLTPLRIRAVTAKDLSELQLFQQNLVRLYNERSKWEKENNGKIVGLVFSKDRALQLHAFLASFCQKSRRPVDLHVLYSSSSLAHEQSYEELRTMCRQVPVRFHRQRNNRSFKEELVRLVENLSAEKVVFFVDDLVVIENLDLDELLQFDSARFVPSLRLGKNISRNYTVGAEQPLPLLQKSIIADQDKIIWLWQDGTLDWGYPLSLDGHIFQRQEILSMLRLVHFAAPNSLEDALQVFRPLFSNRFGLAYNKSKILNIPFNKVQIENKNISGELHQNFLLKKWQEGWAIDPDKVYGFENISPHQEIPLELTERKKYLPVS